MELDFKVEDYSVEKAEGFVSKDKEEVIQIKLNPNSPTQVRILLTKSQAEGLVESLNTAIYS